MDSPFTKFLSLPTVGKNGIRRQVTSAMLSTGNWQSKFCDLIQTSALSGVVPESDLGKIRLLVPVTIIKEGFPLDL